MPMLRAVPTTWALAASRSLALRSGILIWAISVTWASVMTWVYGGEEALTEADRLRVLHAPLRSTVDGVTQSKQITRYVFDSSPTTCGGV